MSFVSKRFYLLMLVFMLGLLTTQAAFAVDSGSVQGAVWCESAINLNAQNDELDGDMVLRGVQVAIHADSNCDGSADTGPITSAITDEAGNYSVPALAFGCYTAQISEQDSALGQCTVPVSGAIQTIAVSESIVENNVNFNFQQTNTTAVQGVAAATTSSSSTTPILIGLFTLGLAFVTLPIASGKIR